MLIPESEIMEDRNGNGYDPEKTERRICDDAYLSNLVRISDETDCSFNEVETIVRKLIASALKSHDWEIPKAVASGSFYVVDALEVPMKTAEANRTKLSDLKSHATYATLPSWVTAYAKIALSSGKACSRYVKDDLDSLIADEKLEKFIEKIEARQPSERVRNIKSYVSLKLISEAVSMLEKDVGRHMDDVVRNPSFFLLLACYQSLHSHGCRPSLFRDDADPEFTYLDIVQKLLERYPKDAFPEIWEYLSEFTIAGDDGDFLASLL